MPIDLEKFLAQQDGNTKDGEGEGSEFDPDKYEDWAEIFETGRPAKGGGKKAKRGDKTTEAIAQRNREEAQAKRRQEALSRIGSELSHFPSSLSTEKQQRSLTDYAIWIEKNLLLKELELNFDPDKGEVEYKNYRKSSGPGGQNVNKTAQTARYTHRVTGIYGESTEERDLIRNQVLAKAKLQIRLEQHLQHWREVFGKNSDLYSAENVREYTKKVLKLEIE